MTYKKLRQEFSRKSFRDNLIKKLGCTCINCEATENMEYHHIVPLRNGGTNKLSNIVPICETCHYKAHDRSSFKNKNGGRPRAISFEEAEPILKRYFNYEIGKSEACDLLGLKSKKGAWDRLNKEYKEKYDIESFYNNIDLLNSQKQRVITSQKNRNR